MDPIKKIFSYINNQDSSATYYRLSIFTLQNTSTISTFSISEFAEKTFVSQSTITRYCQFLGFRNYQDFKKYFLKLSQTTKQSFLKASLDDINKINYHPDIFFNDYCDLIIQSIQDVRESIDLNDIESLIDDIINSNKVALLGYNDSSTIAKDIQLGGLAINKHIDVAESESKFDDILYRYDQQDLIIILSNYGNFFKHYSTFYDKILTANIPLVLVTQNYNSMDNFNFYRTIYLTSKRNINIGNYPMRLFSEYLVRRMLCRN